MSSTKNPDQPTQSPPNDPNSSNPTTPEAPARKKKLSLEIEDVSEVLERKISPS
jgi:hypothetical protein